MPSPTTPLSTEYPLMVAALGATVSTVIDKAVLGLLVLPPDVAVAVKLWTPSASTAVAKLHAPLPLAVAVPSSTAPS
jgi:hypothetical protein